jgi:mRNA-degrading endonuclease toxin of MazEF toxin-antitoxin module
MPFPNVPLDHGHHTRTLVWGDVYWFDFGHPRSNQYTIAGARPCVIVSDMDTLVGQTVIVCPATGVENAVPGYDYHVEVKKVEFNQLDKDSVFKVDHLYNIDRSNLIDEHHIGTLPRQLMRRIFLQLLNALNVERIL